MLTYYVNTASTAGGDGTTNNTVGATRAFVSLNAALTSLPGTLVDATTIYCDGSGGADTTSCMQTPFNHTTTASNYILITTQGGQRHTGTYNTGIYRLEVTNANALYNNLAEHLRIDCIQVKVTVSDGAGYLGIKTINANQTGSAIDCRVTNCIVKGVVTSGTLNGYTSRPSSGTVLLNVMANCIAYDCTNGFTSDEPHARLYNCGAYHNTFGFVNDVNSSLLVKNCIGSSNSSGDWSGTFVSGTDYNAGDTFLGGTHPTGTHAYPASLFQFTNDSSRDFSTLDADRGTRFLGVDLSGDANYPFSTDIVGNPRGSVWDLGPFQNQSTFGTNIAPRVCVKAVVGSGVNPTQTPPVKTIGNAFMMFAVWVDSVTFTSMTDTINGSASGNTWTQIATELDTGTGAGDGGKYRAYYCANANSGVDHVFKLTLSASSAAQSMHIIEIVNASASPLDKNSSIATDGTSPFAASTGSNTTQANELIVGIMGGSDTGSSPVTHASSGSTPSDGNWAIASEQNDATSYIMGGLMWARVTSTGTYTFSYTETGGTSGVVAIATFKELGALLGQICL